MPEVSEAAQSVRKRWGLRILRQPDFVAPTTSIGRPDTLIRHCPGHGQRLTAEGSLRDLEVSDYEVGVRDQHRVKNLRGLALVVCLGPVFEYNVIDIGAHEQMVAPYEFGRQQECLAARIAFTRIECSPALVSSQLNIVLTTWCIVLGDDHNIIPVIDLGSPRTLVLYRPGDRHGRRIPYHQRRGLNVDNRKVRVRGKRSRNNCACLVVIFGIAARVVLVDIIKWIDNNRYLQLPHTR